MLPDSKSTLWPEGSRRRVACRALALCSVVVAIVGASLYYSESRSAAAEQAARDFVLRKGYTNEGYSHTVFSGILSQFVPTSGQKPFAAKRLTGVAFPRDRLTDYMARELLNIRNLANITLYPPDPTGAGVDFDATAVTTVPTLRDLALPLSETSIGLLENRFPKLRIGVADLPSANSGSQSKGTMP
jgi:hypothetical protein